MGLCDDDEEISRPCAACWCLALYVIFSAAVLMIRAYATVDPVRVTVKDASLARLALAAPLDADLRFAGRSFDGFRVAAAGRRVAFEECDEIRVAAAGETSGELLRSDGVAELVKETAAGMFESLELKLSREVRYRPVHLGRYRLAVSCPLRLPTPGTHTMVLDKVIKCH